VAWGYAKQAAKRGVEIHQLTEVQDLIIENGAITAVKTNRGTIKCGCAVQAIAGHSSLLMAKAGIRSPIQTFPLQAMVTQPFKPFLDPLVSSSALHCYVQQTSRGEVVFGGGSDPYPLFNTRSTLDLKESLLAHAIEMFPFLANAKLMRQWAGITDMTPDYSPIMGLSPVKNYYLDAGWGTWGFKATPICGKTMAELVASGGKVPELIKPFGLERFRPSSKSTKWAPRRPATDGARHENHDCPLNGPRNISEFTYGGEFKPMPDPDLQRCRMGRLRVQQRQPRRGGARMVDAHAVQLLVSGRAPHRQR
jgi:sarcosine oxidase subunit beta